MPIEQPLRVKLNVQSVFRASPYRKAAEAAGFTFGKVEVIDTFDMLVMCGMFQCVCGRFEQYCFHLSPHAVSKVAARTLLDPAYHLMMHGSFSKQHLLKDGYTDAQAEDISRKFQEALHG